MDRVIKGGIYHTKGKVADEAHRFDPELLVVVTATNSDNTFISSVKGGRRGVMPTKHFLQIYGYHF